jgi:AcrR family transcriptional regulator
MEKSGAASAKAQKPKQDRSRRMRARLLTAGRRCIERLSYEGMGIGDVAREANCSTGAFYHHFAGKEDFYTAMVAWATEEAAQEVETFFAQPDHQRKTVELFLYDSIALQIKLLRENRELLVATLAKSLSSHDAWVPVRAVGSLLTDNIWQHLNNREVAILDPNPARAVAIACQMMQGTSLQLITISRGPLKIDDDDTIHELQVMMLRYLGLNTYNQACENQSFSVHIISGNGSHFCIEYWD